MNFFRRIFALIFMVLMFCVSAVLVLASFNIVPQEKWAEIAGIVAGNQNFQIIASVIAVIFAIIGIQAPIRLGKRIKKRRTVSFQNPDGEVTVSLAAIEDYIRKVAKNIPGIKDIRSDVDITKKGIEIVSSVSIGAGANIPEVTEMIQQEVKSRVHNMLGVEENINMTIHIKKIIRKGEAIPEAAPEIEPQATANVPFREM